MDPEVEEILEPFRKQVKLQGNLVRDLKANKADADEIKRAVAELKARKKKLEDKEHELRPVAETFDRAKMEDLLKRRFFYDQSFSIYNGVAGQFDFGPMGCAIKANLLNFWRTFFILEEQMLEVDCTILTPENVLKASGHVEKFADMMVQDLGKGDCYRLDHLIKDNLEKVLNDKKSTEEMKSRCRDLIVQLDNLSPQELGAVLKEFDMRAPLTGNELSEPMEFNLMFQTHIGPTGKEKAFLRPETAQGIFVNFKRLLEFNQGRLPFASAQIGNAFRNEISPRSGLIRVREFTMAEIEHFCDPKDKTHPKFESVKDVELILYSACNQMDGKSAVKVTVGEAVNAGTIASETLGYFMARIQLFFVHIGIDPARLRFRQHMSNEMAHYACDCWDGELLTSYGWLECVGCADRSAYDLTQHQKATNVKLVAEKPLSEPRTVEVAELVCNKGLMGKTFKGKAKAINETITQMDLESVLQAEAKLAADGKFTLDIDGESIEVTKDMITNVKRGQKKIHVEEIVPSVIEPSFGIGRIMYALLEHNFRIRDGDEQRRYFTLPPIIAPIKCSVLPLSNNADFTPLVRKLAKCLTEAGVSHKVDESSGSIGRRYARTDEIAVPFGVCVDFDSLKEPHTITLRERDTTLQVRMPLEDVSSVIRELSLNKMSWDEVLQKYPKFEKQESTN